MSISPDPGKPERGRKRKAESRAAELRQGLLAWNKTPEFLRPSLRALAGQLGVSHQLLGHYLRGLEKWQAKEGFRRARQIEQRALAEDRPMTPWEEQQFRALQGEAIRAMVEPMLLKSLETIRQDAKRGPLHPAQFKLLRILAKQAFPGAQELLEKCSQVGLKKRKPFAEIVRETPRQQGETYSAWVKRIWDQCNKYDTKCPRVITEELLQKCSQGSTNNQKNNLPVASSRAAKSFRRERA